MITLQINNESITVEKGTRILDVIKNREDKHRIYGCILNGKIHDLSYRLQSSGTLSLIDQDTSIGQSIYERTMLFVFIVAAKSVYKDVHIRVNYSFSNGLYCEVDGLSDTALYAPLIKAKMEELIKQQKPIKRHVVSKKVAIAHFESMLKLDTAGLLRYRKGELNSIYHLAGYDDYFYEIMLPNTMYIKKFHFQPYLDGFWLSRKSTLKNQPKLMCAFKKAEITNATHGISCVAQLNDKIINHEIEQVINTCEQLMEKQFLELTKHILKAPQGIKVILIAGPSSAGKTTFSRRLAMTLARQGKKPFAISMDDYYKNRANSPKLADGSYDYETIDCVDLTLFHDQLHKLMKEEAVYLAKYNFKTGLREWRDYQTTLHKDSILIIEGIHGLNPLTAKGLNEKELFKIYINDLNALNLDNHNRISTSDYRLIRRIVRDHQFRGYPAKETIATWPKVKVGEELYIYPYQEEANFIFNTSMIYELSVLKRIAVPLLKAVNINEPEYREAYRIKKLLYYFVGIDKALVPSYSILREFIGESEFYKEKV